MNRASRCIGKPVLTPSGTQLATIDEVIIDPQMHQVLCFIVEPGGWGGGAKILPWDTPHTITPRAIIVPVHTQIVLARKLPHIQAVLEEAQVVVGRIMVAPDGRQVGVLQEVYFDQETGAIQEYEIMGGSPVTGAGGRTRLAPDEVEFEKRRGSLLGVSATTAQLIEQRIASD